MHPLSTALFVLGYGLALPIIAKLTVLKAKRSRVGIFGHQIGITIAMVAWAVRGRPTMVVLHLVWMIAVRIWFGNDGTTKRRSAPKE